MTEKIETTEAEEQNGWDAPALARYLNERELAAYEKILNRKKPRPTQANGIRWGWRVR